MANSIIKETNKYSGKDSYALYEELFPSWTIIASSDDPQPIQKTKYLYNKQMQRKNLIDEIKRRTVSYL